MHITNEEKYITSYFVNPGTISQNRAGRDFGGLQVQLPAQARDSRPSQTGGCPEHSEDF